ncbi:hypothetical protein PUN28_010504 [Cardiocondyla obscurior]|uniref:Uncharacterized protein n=1 Tax=Cardiocondyla obscurior TaxID=286306 RepID=A0AAW2FIY9_9HYME
MFAQNPIDNVLITLNVTHDIKLFFFSRRLISFYNFITIFYFLNLFLQINRDDHTYLLRLLGRHSVLLSSV